MLQTSTLSAIKADLAQDEGTLLFPYKDQDGNLTIGNGRNLTAVGISAYECSVLLVNDINRATDGLDRAHPWWVMLPADQQRVMVNLAFNLGLAGLAMFPRFLAAMQRHDWPTAASELVNSRWYGEVGQRAPRLISRLLGTSPPG